MQAAQTALTKGVQYWRCAICPLEAAALLLAHRCWSGSSYPLCAPNGVILLQVLKTHYNFSINQKSTLIAFCTQVPALSMEAGCQVYVIIFVLDLNFTFTVVDALKTHLVAMTVRGRNRQICSNKATCTAPGHQH